MRGDVRAWQWLDDAKCREHPERDQFMARRNTEQRVAARFCADCTVQPWCLDHALTEPEEHGVWGGTTETERKAMRRRIKIEGAA